MIDGVLEYETYTLEIHFEKGDASCRFCPILETYARNQCRRTGEYIADTRGRGRWCPLKKKGEEHE
jgi:hypothetical protein